MGFERNMGCLLNAYIKSFEFVFFTLFDKSLRINPGGAFLLLVCVVCERRDGGHAGGIHGKNKNKKGNLLG